MKYKILIVDDEKSIREIFSLLLQEKGYEVKTAESGTEALARAARFEPDIVLLDMNLPDMSGIETLSRIRTSLPETEVIIITAYGTIKNAVEATKLGAYAYLEKPVDNEEMLLTISRLLRVKGLMREVEDLKTELSARFHPSNIIGTSGRMNAIFQMMDRIIRVDGTVLVMGESGTGKELIARAIHFNGARRTGPFVVVNCGAIPRELVESEFFGHVKGAFTDAKTEKAGKFELAQKGTIFLDEVGELPPEAQVKLLRALGEREIVRVGGSATIPVDVRVIAATNKDLEAAVRKGGFREDLYWRLAVLSLHLPPLRERKEDIPLLCDHFIHKYNEELGRSTESVSPQAMELLVAYPWPGNIRELESILYEAMVMSDSPRIEEQNLPPRVRAGGARPEESAEELGKPLNAMVQGMAERMEREMIQKALEATGGNRTRAAQLLGISRKTLFNKMAALGIDT